PQAAKARRSMRMSTGERPPKKPNRQNMPSNDEDLPPKEEATLPPSNTQLSDEDDESSQLTYPASTDAEIGNKQQSRITRETDGFNTIARINYLRRNGWSAAPSLAGDRDRDKLPGPPSPALTMVPNEDEDEDEAARPPSPAVTTVPDEDTEIGRLVAIARINYLRRHGLGGTPRPGSFMERLRAQVQWDQAILRTCAEGSGAGLAEPANIVDAHEYRRAMENLQAQLPSQAQLASLSGARIEVYGADTPVASPTTERRVKARRD
ncbi:hypothetical protein MPER_03717, partial [Moniliophthora perniciosa FA553]